MDFEKFYDQQKEYLKYRNDSECGEEYKINTLWKMKHLKKNIPDNYKFDSLLEVGCALGHITHDMSKLLNTNNNYGIDISGDNVRFAKSNYPEINFHKGTLDDFEITSLNLTDNRFDIVVLSDIIEHIPDDFGFLLQVKKISNFMVINLPLEKSYSNRNRKYGETDPSGHLRSYNIDDALNLLNKCRLKIISYSTEVTLNDKNNFALWKKHQINRVSKKSFPKKVFWTSLYSLQDFFGKIFPSFYKKLFGMNLFCFVKCHD